MILNAKRTFWGQQVVKVVFNVLGYEQIAHEEGPNFTYLLWRIPIKDVESCDWLTTRLINALNIDLNDHELKCRLKLDVVPSLVQNTEKWVIVKIVIFDKPLVPRKDQR